VVDEGLDPSVAEAFTASPSADPGLMWTYPEDGVALPRNLPLMDFMWQDDLGLGLYQITFNSSTTHVTAITTTAEWQTSAELWRVITSTNSGDSVSVSLLGAEASLNADGSLASSGTVYSAGEQSFRVSRFDAEGAVYFWSTTDSGLRRAEVEGTSSEEWFTRGNGAADGCVGCHVISADGERLAYTWEAVDDEDGIPFYEGLASIDSEGLPTAITEWEEAQRQTGNFSTIDPSGTWRITDSGGVLSIYDARTGEHLSDIPSDIPLTMPDWSPDGTMLVAITDPNMTDRGGEQPQVLHGGIVILDHLGDAVFDTPRDLIPVDMEGYNNYFPMFSPDSLWIAFNRATGPYYFNEDAALFLISAGGGDAIELVTANQAPGQTNSWPRWGPMPDDDVLWLAFASTRAFGNYPSDPALAQIWITAVDTYTAEDGVDPSYPAFRMVQQDRATSNHTPWWSLF
jgi:Tol biopolymer transport system component